VSWRAPQERHARALDGFYGRFPQAAEAVFVTRDTFASLANGTLIAPE